MPAERAGSRLRDRPQAVERECSPHVAGERRRHGIGDRGQPVEIDVPTVLQKFPSHRQRQPEQPVQVQVGFCIRDHIWPSVVDRRPMQRHAAPGFLDDRVVHVARQARAVCYHRLPERVHKLARSRRIEVPDRARNLADR